MLVNQISLQERASVGGEIENTNTDVIIHITLSDMTWFQCYQKIEIYLIDPILYQCNIPANMSWRFLLSWLC